MLVTVFDWLEIFPLEENIARLHDKFVFAKIANNVFVQRITFGQFTNYEVNPQNSYFGVRATTIIKPFRCSQSVTERNGKQRSIKNSTNCVCICSFFTY